MEELNTNITERRRQTRSAIFSLLYESPEPCTKQSIAKKLNLSLPTVYQNIDELIEAGYIECCGFQPSQAGRPAMGLRVVNGIRYAIGVSITQQKIRFALTDLSKEELAYKSVPHGIDVRLPEFTSFVVKELELFIDENGLDRDRILGVGITLAGIIKPNSNKVLYAPTLRLIDFSLDAVTKAIPYPVYIENDASSGGFAEWFNKSEDSNIAYLSLEEGVGGALFINGEPYFGKNNRSGEFGHMCVEIGGRRCKCGKLGCLEAYCSSLRIQSDFGTDYEEFFARLDAGDEKALRIWEDYKSHLATGIVNIRMAMDCEIVLGGFLAEYLKPRLPEITELLRERDSFDHECSYLKISHLPKYGSILGVALSFIREFVNSI